MNDILVRTKEEELKTIASIWKDFNPARITEAKNREEAMVILKDVKNISRDIEQEAKNLFAPIKEAMAEAKAKFDEPLLALKNAEAKIKATVLQYDEEVRKQIEEQARRQQEEENRLVEEQKAKLRAEAEAESLFGDQEVAKIIISEAEAMTASKIAEVDVKQKGRRLIWDFEIEDVSKIPAHYMQPNLTLIRSAIISNKGQIKIDGVRAFQKPILAS